MNILNQKMYVYFCFKRSSKLEILHNVHNIILYSVILIIKIVKAFKE